MKKFEAIGTNGQLTVASTEIYSKRLVVVQKDGIGASKIVFTGTPINKEVKYSSSFGVGAVTFPQPFSQMEPVLVLYEDAEQVCEPPVIQSGVSLTSGIVNQPYSSSFVMNGTQPFIISDEVLPDGLSVGVNNEFVTISGTPTSAGAQPISFTVNNDCGSYNFSGEEINITNAPPENNLDWTYSNIASTNGRFVLKLNGMQIINRTTSGSGTITAQIGDTILIEVYSGGIVNRAIIDITGPYTVSHDEEAFTTDSFIVAVGQYTLDLHSL